MKEFFKLAKLKIGLAIGILAFYFIEGILYNVIVFHNKPISEIEMGEINVGLKIIHYISQAIFIPIDAAGDIFMKSGMYFFDNSDFFYFSVAPIFILPLFIFYCYFLGCLTYFLIKKKGSN